MSLRLTASRFARAVRSASLTAAVATLLVATYPARPLSQAGSLVLSVELPDGPSAGARLFSQKGCARCHALGGVGPQIGPDLGGTVLLGNVLELTGAFWNHAPVMSAKMQELGIRRPAVTTTEMADLVAYLTAFRYYDNRVRAPGNPVAGRRVFVEKNCAECHEGPASWITPGPNLQKYRGRYAPIFLAQAMWNHSTQMSAQMQTRGMPWPTLTGTQMTDLVAYLQIGSTADAAEPVYFEPGSPRRGQTLFAQKRCGECHAIAGKGGHGGPDLGMRGREMARSVPDLAAMMWNHRQQMHAEFTRRGIPFVTFEGQEMADVVAYLYFVNYARVSGTPERGRAIFARHCSACHTQGEKHVGPDLSTAPGLDTPIGIIAAMWNHATRMEEQVRQRGLTWPRLAAGDTADLTAFLIASHRPASSPGR
ncbi:MAG: c-type cytochrome [Acidobacteria bacterium]|nr:c-type cytochrome [Acidobacteriota bacterium]